MSTKKGKKGAKAKHDEELHAGTARNGPAESSQLEAPNLSPADMVQKIREENLKMAELQLDDVTPPKKTDHEVQETVASQKIDVSNGPVHETKEKPSKKEAVPKFISKKKMGIVKSSSSPAFSIGASKISSQNDFAPSGKISSAKAANAGRQTSKRDSG